MILLPKVNAFYCTAVPRSGTTYFCHLLNSHPNVLCGMESIEPRYINKDFFNNTSSFIGAMASARAVEYARLHLEGKSEILSIGEKYPAAYFCFDHIVSQFQDGVIFFLIRNPLDVFYSWDKRAFDVDDNWGSLRNWFCAFLDIIYSLEILSKSTFNNIYLINYDYLINAETREAAARNVFKVLGFELNELVDFFLKDSLVISNNSKKLVRVPTRDQASLLDLDCMIMYKKMISDIKITPLNQQLQIVLSDVLQGVELECSMNNIRPLVMKETLNYWKSVHNISNCNMDIVSRVY